MTTTNTSWKSRLKSIFSNSYLSFGLGVLAGLAFDNLFMVVALAAVVGAGIWYARKGNDEGSEPQP